MAVWFEDAAVLPDSLTYEDNGAAKPLRDHPFVKESPTIEHFVKKAFDTHREFGSRIPTRVEQERNPEGKFTPKADAVANWRKEHLPKLYNAGLLDAPPASPEAYVDVIKRPESLPDGLSWDEERAKKAATVFHKYGIPKAAAPELMGIMAESLLANQYDLKTDFDTAMVALHKEFPSDFETRQAAADRLARFIFQNPAELEMYEKSGIGNHPRFLSVMMRLAPLAEQDTSILQGMRTGGTMTPEDVRYEVMRIQTDQSHPMYQGFKRSDPSVLKHIESLYAKLPNATQKVIIGGEVPVNAGS